MHTLKIKINDQAYPKLISFLKELTPSEVEILHDDLNSIDLQNYLNQELNDLDSNTARLLTVNEAEDQLEKRIKKHEDRH